MTAPGYKGQRHAGVNPNPTPARGNNQTSLNEVRNEMRRLMGIYMKTTASYRARERTIVEYHQKGHHQFTGQLSTVMNNDLLLSQLGGTSKTLATLIQGCSAYILAEVALHERSMKYGGEE